MAYELKLPDLGEGVAEGEIARWLVEVGESVEEDDPLVEIQTDKTTVEIPSPAAGGVARILAAEGDLVPVGSSLLVIASDPDEATADDAAEPSQRREARVRTAPGRAAGHARVQATPLVRRIAAQLGVDLAAVTGSGPAGRITEEDVRSAASGAPDRERQGRRVPLRGVRREVARNVALSHREVAAVTVVEECDFSAIAAARGERSYLAYVLAATVAALKEYPELNATLSDDEIVFWDRYDVGIAVQTDEGLVVPVVRSADEKSIDELASESRRLAEGARARTLKPEELRGSTFTVTSAGRLGGLFATPLVNYPEVAILGLHRISERPAVVDGQVAIRPIGWLSCTFDHRAADGARASAFLVDVIGRLEQRAQ